MGIPSFNIFPNAKLVPWPNGMFFSLELVWSFSGTFPTYSATFRFMLSSVVYRKQIRVYRFEILKIGYRFMGVILKRFLSFWGIFAMLTAPMFSVVFSIAIT
jgi:hypothetical protein